MTRNQIYDAWSRAGVSANGAFARDDEVERAYAEWCAAGRPQGASVEMARAADREFVLIDCQPAVAGGVDLSGDDAPEGGVEL